jgi:hypothetical protein
MPTHTRCRTHEKKRPPHTWQTFGRTISPKGRRIEPEGFINTTGSAGYGILASCDGKCRMNSMGMLIWELVADLKFLQTLA